MCVCVCIYSHVCVSVYVCICILTYTHTLSCDCVCILHTCIHVCVRERDRERERLCVCMVRCIEVLLQTTGAANCRLSATARREVCPSAVHACTLTHSVIERSARMLTHTHSHKIFFLCAERAGQHAGITY